MYTDYKQAFNAAVDKANLANLDVALRAVKEFGKKGYCLSYASKNDSDYFRAEIVKPGTPKMI